MLSLSLGPARAALKTLLAILELTAGVLGIASMLHARSGSGGSGEHEQPQMTGEDVSLDSPQGASERESEARREELSTRRQLLTGISIAAAGVGATIVSIPVIGSLLTPLVKTGQAAWRPVGSVNQFMVGDTVEVTFENAQPLPWAGVTSNSAAYLRRQSAQSFIAFAINCTHLGCPLRWIPDAELFMCPCHGGVFYGDGTVAAGPPLVPMSVYPTRINNGQVEILTSPVPITH